MRARILVAVVWFGFLTVIFAPNASMGQRPGFGGPPGSKSSKSGGFTSLIANDPEKAFTYMSKGKGYITIAETFMLRDTLAKFAEEQGIKDGKITLAQFNLFAKQVKEKSAQADPAAPMGAGLPAAPPAPMGDASKDNGPTKKFGFPGKDAGKGGDAAAYAELEFRRRDDNGDGMLNRDEMSDSLRDNLQRYDASKDGLINLEEYKGYLTARMEERNKGNSGPRPDVVNIIIEDDDRRPLVFRAGKLPKELPGWFEELDTDKDGQVALPEWRKGGKASDEFRGLDRNDDGLITAEEVLRFQTHGKQGEVAKNGEATADKTDAGKGTVGKGNFGKGNFGKSSFKKKN